MTNEQFDILCALSGTHERTVEARECSRKVFVEGLGVAEVCKGRGATFYRGVYAQVKRLKKAQELCEKYGEMK